ncbi:MAG: DNA gyrase subunit A [Alphaproteobacteria bacterium]|nr:DNA gyrase subunit A [Alphaproteobacteria bacterium]
MRRSYLDYAMSVIVSRAIPDARDGLKPVHRRILFAMHESGCDWNRAYKKSARIVGEVMGKYHPHGDSAIYDSLVRMAQDFSLRLPLIDGQGNFGSMDGDSPAAMRYTESRLAKSAHRLLTDIDKDTVGFQPNYDGSEKEPQVLPAEFPNLLVNGAGGIAVGMATNIPPHNLGEVIDACCMYIDNPETTIDDMMTVMPGPDFPTGGIILGRKGSHSALHTGRGSVIMRGKTHFEDISSGRQAIIVTEMPYQVNKAKMVELIAELVRDKRIEGISDLRDESDRSGVRVVVELKRDAFPEIVLNQLFKFTPLQTSFGVNMLALDLGRPALMNVKDVIVSFVRFREEVITRRTRHLLGKARDRAHILIGLSMAVANIDEVIALIRKAPDPQTAREQLMARDWVADNVAPLIALVADKHNKIVNGRCYFTEAQARAILEMRLSRLTGLEQDKLTEELTELAVEIEKYLAILDSREILMGLLRSELLAVKEEFATPRRSQFEESEYEHDIEDLIPREEMVVTVTHGGYIKRVPLSTYRAQKRGGKGRTGVNMYEDDITTNLFVANTHMPLLFFSSRGQVYKMKVYRIPEGGPQTKGRALVNLLPLQEGERISTVMPLPEKTDEWEGLNIMFSTAQGNVRRNDLSDFHYIPSNGKIAIRMEESDRLIDVALCRESEHILLASRQGQSLRFPIDAVRVFKSRTSDGVRGMKLADKDEVVSMTVLNGAEQDVDTRDAFLKIPSEIRSELNTALKEETPDEAKIQALLEQIHALLSPELIQVLPQTLIREWVGREQFILTITENGYGKRTSAYEYRITNRGGSGVVNIITSDRNGNVVASFPVIDSDQVMMVTDKGKIIRSPVGDIRITGRNTQGVTLFRTADAEKVVSASRVPDTGGKDEGESGESSDDVIEPTSETPAAEA